MTEYNEKKTVGASYIFSFYQEINNLTDNYSIYINLLLELQSKYGLDFGDKAGDEEKQIINNWLQTVRHHCHKAYIQYITLSPHLNIPADKSIEKQYSNIATKFVIDKEDLKNFVVAMNSVLVNGVIQEILSSHENYLNDLKK